MPQKNTSPRILLVTKGPGDSYSLAHFLLKLKCDCQIVHSMKEARRRLEREAFRLVLSELQLADGNARELASLLKGSDCSLYLSIPVEDACWWLPAVMKGSECLGEPALRPHEFTQALGRMLKAPVVSSARVSSS